jgi:hypothetical protein
MFGLRQIKARIARLQELENGLAAELDAWNGRDSPLLPVEWVQYRDGIQSAIAGLFEAREVLEEAVRRLDEPPPPKARKGERHIYGC